MSIFKRKHESVAPHEMDDGLSRNEFLKTMMAAAALPIASKAFGGFPDMPEPKPTPKTTPRQSVSQYVSGTTMTQDYLSASFVGFTFATATQEDYSRWSR